MENKKRIIILILLLVIGFASVTTTLVISGVVGISSKQDDFDVIFTNAKLDGVDKKEFIDESTEKTITFETNKLTTLNETTTLEYEVANKSRLYDADVSITCNLVNSANPEQVITSEYVEMKYLPITNKMTVLAGKSEKGSITAKLIKSSTEDKSIKVKCTLTANATERTSLGAEYKEPIVMPTGVELIADANNDGTLNVGDEIAIGEEHFYVISKENDKINALAKYNLNVGGAKNSNVTEGIQHETVRGWVLSGTTYGNIKFSNQKGWSYENNDTIDIRNQSYGDGTVKTALYGTNGYESHIKKTIPTATVRLITKGEIEILINDGNELSTDTKIKEKADAKGYSWLYYTTYWLGSAFSNNASIVWNVGSNGFIGSDDFDYNPVCGVRPIVTIPLS